MIEEARDVRFNGAAVRGRRKYGAALQGLDGLKFASMGPPSEDGGNVPLLGAWAHPWSASMGPPSEDGGNLPTSVS